MRKYREIFNGKNVEHTFIYMLKVLETKWDNKEKFSSIKNACKRLSGELKCKVESTSNIRSLLNKLADTPDCNWMEVENLKLMALVAEVPQAESIIKIYEDCTYNRKCSEVMMHVQRIIEKYDEDVRKKVIDKLEKTPHMTVNELIKYLHGLENLF